MPEYEFTLRLDEEVTEAQADALYGTCPDAALAVGPGTTLIEFTREATSWGHVLESAVRDVEAATGLLVTGVGREDLVTVRDIASRSGRSREAVRLWAAGRRGPGGFPAPAWTSQAGERFWSWAEVAQYLNFAVDLTPDEIRWADLILKARHAAAEARRALAAADAETRRELERLLGTAA